MIDSDGRWECVSRCQAMIELLEEDQTDLGRFLSGDIYDGYSALLEKEKNLLRRVKKVLQSGN